MPRQVGYLQKCQLPESYVPQWIRVLSYVRMFIGRNDVPQASGAADLMRRLIT